MNKKSPSDLKKPKKKYKIQKLKNTKKTKS